MSTETETEAPQILDAELPAPPAEPTLAEIMAQMKAMQEQMGQMAEYSKSLEDRLIATTHTKLPAGTDVGVVTDERFARRVVLHNRAADEEFVRANLPWALLVHENNVVGLPKEESQ